MKTIKLLLFCLVMPLLVVAEETPQLTFEDLPDLNLARSSHLTLVVSQDKYAVFGGHVTNFLLTNTAEIYNANSNQWVQRTMKSSHDMGFIAPLENGKYLIGAGCSQALGVGQLKNTEIYNPEDDSFVAAANLNTARTVANAATLTDGRVLVVGNWYASAANAEIFNPETGKFINTGSCIVERSNPIVIPTNDGGALVLGSSHTFGGTISKFNVEKYDANTNSFTEIATTLFEEEITSWTIYGPPSGYDANSCKLPDGRYLVLAHFHLSELKRDLVRLLIVDPETCELSTFETQSNISIFDDNAPDIKFSNYGVPFVDRDKNLVHIVQLGGVTPDAYLRIITIDIETREVFSCVQDGFDYYIASGTTNLLPDGRLLFVAGMKPDNFTMSNKACIVTVPSYQTSIPKLPENNKISLYPNPVKDILQIDLQGFNTSKASIDIINIDGKILKTQAINNNTKVKIDMSNFAEGVYFCRFNNGVETQSLRVVKF